MSNLPSGCTQADLDRLRIELNESQWLTKNAVDELAALKEIHANCETEIHLRALMIQAKNSEIEQLRVQLNEANRLWNASLEVQTELEEFDLKLRKKIKDRIAQMKQRHQEISEYEPDMRVIGRIEGNIGSLEWVLRETEGR